MFNSTYVRGGNTTNNNNIEINSVTGTLVKNYRKSFFFRCKEDSNEADRLFDPENHEFMCHMAQREQLRIANIEVAIPTQFTTKML